MLASIPSARDSCESGNPAIAAFALTPNLYRIYRHTPSPNGGNPGNLLPAPSAKAGQPLRTAFTSASGTR
jgi:hypothetical protein